MLKEFREFLEKFNVIPAAVGLVLALAIVPVMEAVVELIMQVIAKLAGSKEPAKALETVDLAGMNIGPVISATVTFILIAFVVFMIIKTLAKVGAKTTAAPTPDQALLTEIRDALKAGR